MANIQKTGAFAAFANAFLGIAMLVVAFTLIGPNVLSDQTKLVEMALTNPGPFFLQDGLKLISAVLAGLIVLALAKHLQGTSPGLVYTGIIFGVISILLLLANAALSSYAIAQAAKLGAEMGAQLNLTVVLLGMASILTNGIWYLLENWAGQKSQRLPKGLTALGLVIGAISLVPLLSVFVLLLSIVWSIWLGRVFLKNE